MQGGLKLLKREKNSIEVELVGEDHTMANLIAKYAIRHRGVIYSSYIISHPLTANPVIVITTDGSVNPMDVLEQVLKEIINDANAFLAEFEKALSNAGEKCEVKV